MCTNGKKLMRTITELVVDKKRSSTEENFYKLYSDLTNIGGELFMDFNFNPILIKRKNHKPLVHFPDEADVMYYSSYGEDGKLERYL